MLDHRDGKTWVLRGPLPEPLQRPPALCRLQRLPLEARGEHVLVPAPLAASVNPLETVTILKQAGQSNPFATLPILELNPAHPLVERLKTAADDAAFADLGYVLYDQAMLSEGGELEDPVSFVQRVNRLIVEGLSAAPKIILG